LENPCKQCVVTSMCIDPCSSFIAYLEIIVGKKREPDFVEVTATRLRDGSATLTETQIIYHNKDRWDEHQNWAYNLPVGINI